MDLESGGEGKKLQISDRLRVLKLQNINFVQYFFTMENFQPPNFVSLEDNCLTKKFWQDDL